MGYVARKREIHTVEPMMKSASMMITRISNSDYVRSAICKLEGTLKTSFDSFYHYVSADPE